MEEIKGIINNINSELDTIHPSNPRLNSFNTNLKKDPFRYNEDDMNDYPTPIEFFNLLMDRIKENKIFGNVDYDNFVDLCCSEKNRKFEKGLTIDGSVGIDLPLYGDSLKQNWNEIAPCGFLASPYKDKNQRVSIQNRFSQKAFDESNKGMKIVAMFQSSTDAKWYHEYVILNPNCVYIQLLGRLKYPGTKNHPGYGNTIVLFGINKISKEDMDYIRTLIPKYIKMTKKPKVKKLV